MTIDELLAKIPEDILGGCRLTTGGISVESRAHTRFKNNMEDAHALLPVVYQGPEVLEIMRVERIILCSFKQLLEKRQSDPNTPPD